MVWVVKEKPIFITQRRRKTERTKNIEKAKKKREKMTMSTTDEGKIMVFVFGI